MFANFLLALSPDKTCDRIFTREEELLVSQSPLLLQIFALVERKESKWHRMPSLTLAHLVSAGGECTYILSSVKLFNQWKFFLVLDAKNRWHFIFPIGNTTQKCIFHYFSSNIYCKSCRGGSSLSSWLQQRCALYKTCPDRKLTHGAFPEKIRVCSALKILFEQLWNNHFDWNYSIVYILHKNWCVERNDVKTINFANSTPEKSPLQ